MYPYSNYSHQNDTRYFSNPQFPEPKKSSSWFGWLLIAIGTGLAGYLFGQRNLPKDPQAKPLDLGNTPKSEAPPEPQNEATTSEAKPEVSITEKFVRLEDLTEEMVNNYIDNVNGHEYNLAEQLWYKQQMQNNPKLIEKFPKLAKFLGLI